MREMPIISVQWGPGKRIKAHHIVHCLAVESGNLTIKPHKWFTQFMKVQDKRSWLRCVGATVIQHDRGTNEKACPNANTAKFQIGARLSPALTSKLVIVCSTHNGSSDLVHHDRSLDMNEPITRPSRKQILHYIHYNYTRRRCVLSVLDLL